MYVSIHLFPSGLHLQVMSPDPSNATTTFFFNFYSLLLKLKETGSSHPSFTYLSFPPCFSYFSSTMANSVNVTKLPKLSGKNYCDWRSLLKDVLVLKDLWGPLFEAAPVDDAVALAA